jgi:hypothetical protein
MNGSLKLPEDSFTILLHKNYIYIYIYIIKNLQQEGRFAEVTDSFISNGPLNFASYNFTCHFLRTGSSFLLTFHQGYCSRTNIFLVCISLKACSMFLFYWPAVFLYTTHLLRQWLTYDFLPKFLSSYYHNHFLS